MKRWRLPAALAALAAIAALALWARPSAVVSPGPASAALTAAAKDLDEISIEASFSPESRTLAVRQTFALVSRTSESRDTLVLRAYPNAFQSAATSPCATEESYDLCYPQGFSAGSLVVEEASADGVPLSYRYLDEAKTVLSLALKEPWESGESLRVSVRYLLTVPRAAYRFGVSGGVWALGNAFLVPAFWENGAYRTDAYESVGDPLAGDPANYTVTLTAPKGFSCAASAWPRKEAGEQTDVYRFSAPAVREFALVLSEGYQEAQAMEGGVALRALAGAHADEALRYAQSALRVFSQLYGEYPYPSLTVAGVAFPMGGMEYPGLVMIGERILSAGGKELEYAVAHEVAHQWWYALVGSDSVNQAWQDEALCEFSVLSYVEHLYGKAARETLYEDRIAASMRVTMPRGVTPGAPLSYFHTAAQYQTLVYERGAAMLCALNDMTGNRLDDFLKRYAERYAFGRASREDFLTLLNQFAGEDLKPLMVDYLDTYIAP